MNFEMMQVSIQQEKAEKYALLMPQLKEAVKNQDWEEVETWRPYAYRAEIRPAGEKICSH